MANCEYLCESAFWIVHHDAIDAVYDLALGFWHKAKDVGLIVDVSVALGCAMQILCADPDAHLLLKHPEVWAGDDKGLFRDTLPDSNGLGVASSAEFRGGRSSAGARPFAE
jgi:hypothetical protein